MNEDFFELCTYEILFTIHDHINRKKDKNNYEYRMSLIKQTVN